MAFGEIGGVRGDLVGDDAGLHVVAVGQTQMLLRRDIAEHRGAEPADHRRADRRGDVVVAGRDVGGQRARACRTAPRRTTSSCWSMFSLIMCIGTWPGPSIITWTSCFHAILRQLAQRSSSANCASSLASAIEPGRRPSPSEKVTS